MARSFERTLCEGLGPAYAITKRPETSQSLVLCDLSDDLQVGALIHAAGVSKTAVPGVDVGMRAPSVERLQEEYICHCQQQRGWAKITVPLALTIFDRLPPTEEEGRDAKVEQTKSAIERLCEQAEPDAESLRTRLLKLLANAETPYWIEEPVGAALVQKALIVRALEGRCSEAVANALIKKTPYAAAYRQAVHRFRQWLESREIICSSEGRYR